MLSRGGFGILTGWATDKYGSRIVVTLGGLCITLGLLLTSQTSAHWQLYIYYSVLLGLGVSVAFSPLVATTARWFVNKRGLAVGIVLAGIGLGTAIMPQPAIYLIDVYGWSMAYIIMGVIAFIAIVPAGQLLIREPRETEILPYGETETTTQNTDALMNKNDLYYKGRGILLREAIRKHSFWILFVVTILFAICLYMVMIHIVPHVTDLRIPVPVAGGLLTAIGISTILGRFAAGWVSDRIGRKITLLVCLSCQAAAVFSLMGIRDVSAFYVVAVVFGVAYGGVVTQLPLLAVELFGLRSSGSIIGLEMLGTSIGGAIGPVLGGYFFDVTSSYNLAFLISAICVIVAMLLILLLRLPRKERRQTPFVT
jgi:MFS family permease